MQGNRSKGSDFFSIRQSKLILNDGQTFSGKVPSWQKDGVWGEVVFNTGMSGYTESMTDPSYSGQILVFTYPLIGNYGVDMNTMESNKIHAKAIIVSTLENDWSHNKSTISLLQWCADQGIPIMMDVDTRALTKYLRTRGTMLGSFGKAEETMISSTQFVTIAEPILYSSKSHKKVILIDCGSKENIVRSLQQLPISLKRVPYDYDYTKDDYDGIFISNGPGDPEDYVSTIAILKKALKIGKPIYGICLGSQLLALAAGAKTYKLKFGHRGHNQPCMNIDDSSCYITSQNHGFAVDEKSLPKDWKVTYRNLNDNSVEGIAHKTKPFYTVQFHPEACPGPTDTAFIFERFYEQL